MSGTVTMALGPFMFQAHGLGYSGTTRVLDTSWVEIETAGRLNALQWTGPRSKTISITGVLFPLALGGQNGLDGIKLAAESGTPLMLVSLGGRIFGRHAIQQIDEDQEYYNRFGAPAQNSYTIELKSLGSGFSLTSFLGKF